MLAYHKITTVKTYKYCGLRKYFNNYIFQHVSNQITIFAVIIIDLTDSLIDQLLFIFHKCSYLEKSCWRKIYFQFFINNFWMFFEQLDWVLSNIFIKSIFTFLNPFLIVCSLLELQDMVTNSHELHEFLEP
jgi:hypothetical protein